MTVNEVEIGNSAPATTSSNTPSRWRALDLLRRVGIGGGLLPLFIVVVIGFSLAIDGFASSSTFVNVISLACVLLIVALGQLLVVIAGGFDLSVGGVVPLSGVVYCVVTSAGASWWVALLAVLGIGVGVGVVHMIVISYFQINPLITTLATLSVTGGCAFLAAGGKTVQMPPSAGRLGDIAVGSFALYAFLTLGLVVLTDALLRWTIFGRRVYMVGGNREAARLAGVRVVATEGGAYILSGCFAALAGIVLASQLLAAAGNIGTDVTLTSVAAVVLGGAALTGGKGSVPGAVLGVVLLGTIDQALTILRVASFYQQIVTGAVLLLAVALSKWQERLART